MIMHQFLRKNIACVIWFISVITGMFSLWAYSQRDGGFGELAEQWPNDSRLTPEPDKGQQQLKKQLIMFVHPQCPCSRASLGELAVLMRHSQGRVLARVLFVSPQGQSSEWVRSGLWAQAERIPHVIVEIDHQGVEAGRFGAVISGATLLYDASGHLLFHGGITAARGHFGDNVGRLAIQKFVNGSDATAETPVFGCPLI